MYIAVSVGSSDCNHYLLYPDKILSYIAHNARNGAPLKETSMLSSYRFWTRKCRSVTASGRHLRGVWAFITLHGAHCTPAPAPELDSSGPCSRTCTMHHASSFSSTTRKPVHDVGCSASERSWESMGERQGRTSSVESKCVVPALGLGLGLGGARRLRSQIRLGPYDARGARQREGGFDAVARLMGQVRNNVRCGWMGRKTRLAGIP